MGCLSGIFLLVAVSLFQICSVNSLVPRGPRRRTYRDSFFDNDPVGDGFGYIGYPMGLDHSKFQGQTFVDSEKTVFSKNNGDSCVTRTRIKKKIESKSVELSQDDLDDDCDECDRKERDGDDDDSLVSCIEEIIETEMEQEIMSSECDGEKTFSNTKTKSLMKSSSLDMDNYPVQEYPMDVNLERGPCYNVPVRRENMDFEPNPFDRRDDNFERRDIIGMRD
uniref:Uncharacterized protein n=1 Tax=Graphocephala atropunctata TaxID=36148 RepID=A0A1B6KRP2_9HEMI